MSKKPNQKNPRTLRKFAEAELAHRAPPMAEQARPAEELLHELQVYQIELEMQNEALRQSQIELEESRDRYLDLYDFAPVGLLTLTPETLIAEINFTAAALLGEERNKLLNRRFTRFVAPEDSDLWHRYFLQALKKDGAHHCELTLQHGDGSRLQVGVGCLSIKPGGKLQAVRVALTDITAREQAELEQRRNQQLLRELAAKDVILREAESKHVAREVHDELGQILTALRMEVSLLRIQYGKLDPAIKIKAGEMLALVDKAIQGMRNVVSNLRPVALDMGIVPAIGWLCDNFAGRADTACTVRVSQNPVGLDDARTTALFRIVQESLTNVVRYAEANSVEIVIGQQGNQVLVQVFDDGKGFDLESVLKKKKTFGLMGMRERALAVGGEVEISSAPAKGTVVSIRIPIHHKEHRP